MVCRAAAIGGTRKFLDFIRQCGVELTVYSEVGMALADTSWDTILILPKEGADTVEQLTLEQITLLAQYKQSGKHIYAEMYNAYNMYQASVFGCEVLGKTNHITGQCLCADSALKYVMDGSEILQATGCAYLPSTPRYYDTSSKNREVLLKIGSYVGAVNPVKKDIVSYPALIRSGNVFTSLIKLSEFDTASFHPYRRWQQLYGWLFSELLNADPETVRAAFERVNPRIKTRFEPDEKLEADRIRDYAKTALLDAVKWHFDSGIVLPGDGSRGSVEMIMSNTHELYNNRRVDAGMYTGWLIYASGRLFGNREWEAKGKNIFDYFAVNGQIDGGTKDGLYKWYYNEYAYPRKIFSIDSGRCGIALINMYRFSGDEELLKRITRLADAFCRWEKNGLFTAPETGFDVPSSDSPFEGQGACTASIYAEDSIFLTYVWRLTGNDKYLDTIVRIVDRLVEAYPNYMYYGHTTSSRNARLLAAMLAVRRTGRRKYSELINRMIDYLASLQLPGGGIYSEDNLSFEHFGDEKNNTIGENGITVPWESEKISDQLYCVNNTLMALSMLRGLEGESDIHVRKGLALRAKLLEYIIKIQITGKDKRFAGGWMRAFDMTLGEYYGMDLDKYWGAYCIMAGWTMGILPLALLEEITGDCFYAPQINIEPGE